MSEISENKKRNIIVVAHKFLTQPDDDLVLFLNGEKKDNVLHIHHSFSDASDRRSYAIWYKNGNEFRRFQTMDFKKFPEPIIYLKETLFTFWIILRTRIKWNMYIGMDGLCVGWGNLLRSFGRLKRTAYWAIDFVPENRFRARFKNYIYQKINISGYRQSDEMWDLSPRMAEAREKFLGIKFSDYQSHKIVPYGMWIDRIKRFSYEECEKDTVVFMGHLIEKQGVQLIIQAIPDIIKEVPNFKFKIIGGGNYGSKLIELARKLDVLKYCDFHGKIDDIIELEKEVAISAVAVAPYIKELDTWTYYADPGKIKTYLACGVPLLLTDIPWNAGEIEKNGCGKIICEEKSNIVKGIIDMMNSIKNQECRSKALEYSKRFDYKNIFSNLFI